MSPGPFDKWDERYQAPGFAYGETPNDFLAAEAGRIPPGRVLSLGEGEGRNALLLAGLGFEVTGVDGSAVGLAKAEARAAAAGLAVRTVHADLETFDLGDACWEGIVSIFCHMPPNARRSLHRRIVQGLAPGGVFLMEAYTPRQLDYGTGGPPVLDLLVKLDEVRAELGDLEALIAREQERQVCEGRLHTGLAHVAQFVGRKPA